MNWENQLTKTARIHYPVIQAPMLGVTTPEMVAAVSNEGGLGSLPVGGLSPEKTKELIRKTKSLTQKPFAVNLFAHSLPETDTENALQMQEFLIALGKQNGISFPVTPITAFSFYTYQQQIPILIDEQIPIVSFTFGILDDNSIRKLKEHHIILIGTATCLEEALLLNNKDIDMIVAQGIEAGGHRGSFLEHKPLPQIGLTALLSEITHHIAKPVLASGAINNGKTIKAAFAMGASGVQIGTAFIATDESIAIPAYKEAVLAAQDTDSELTQTFSGRWARGLKNRFMDALDKTGINIPPYPVQNSLTTAFRQIAQQQNNKDFTNLWSGQSAPKIHLTKSAAVFRELIRQTEAIT